MANRKYKGGRKHPKKTKMKDRMPLTHKHQSKKHKQTEGRKRNGRRNGRRRIGRNGGKRERGPAEGGAPRENKEAVGAMVEVGSSVGVDASGGE